MASMRYFNQVLEAAKTIPECIQQENYFILECVSEGSVYHSGCTIALALWFALGKEATRSMPNGIYSFLPEWSFGSNPVSVLSDEHEEDLTTVKDTSYFYKIHLQAERIFSQLEFRLEKCTQQLAIIEEQVDKINELLHS